MPRSHAEAVLIHTRARTSGRRVMSRNGALTVSHPPSFAPQPPAVAQSVLPTEFGADPTGNKDSTAAIRAAMAFLLSSNRSLAPMASGIRNVGGAMLDLAGGSYLISSPVVVPLFVGNIRIGGGGTLRASKNFPMDQYLIEIGGGVNETCVPRDKQNVCNEVCSQPQLQP